MIQAETRMRAADNSGAREIQCIKVLGGSRRRYARVGDVIVASVKTAAPSAAVKKKEVVRAVIVRTRYNISRRDGSTIRFDENAVVILEKGKMDPLAGRVFGPLPRELAEMGFQKIASLAPEIV